MAKKTKKSVSKTKKVHRKTVGFAIKTVREIQTLMGKRNGKKITLKEIRAMLKYLLDNYNDVSYKKGILTLQTDDIICDDYNNGTFSLRLNLKIIFASAEGFVVGLKLEPRGCRHVYSSSGNLCFGNGYWAIKKCANDGRIDDFIDIVQQILRT